jgi:hypothetical protein
MGDPSGVSQPPQPRSRTCGCGAEKGRTPINPPQQKWPQGRVHGTIAPRGGVGLTGFRSRPTHAERRGRDRPRGGISGWRVCFPTVPWGSLLRLLLIVVLLSQPWGARADANELLIWLRFNETSGPTFKVGESGLCDGVWWSTDTHIENERI